MAATSEKPQINDIYCFGQGTWLQALEIFWLPSAERKFAGRLSEAHGMHGKPEPTETAVGNLPWSPAVMPWSRHSYCR